GFLDPLLARLREAGAGPTDPTPKHVRALGPKALETPEVVAEELDKNANVVDLVRKVIAGAVASLLRRDPLIRVGDDPENIHKARVETRRLRTMLRIFRRLLDADWASSLRTELGWLADELGGVRDRQVLLARLQGKAADLPADDRPALTRLTERLAVEAGPVRGRSGRAGGRQARGRLRPVGHPAAGCPGRTPGQHQCPDVAAGGCGTCASLRGR